MKILFLIIIFLCVLYLIICLFVYFFQHLFVFYPQKGASPHSENLDIVEKFISTSDKQKLHAWWMTTDTNAYTVLFFHGNAGNISRGNKRMHLFHEMGYNALAVDYRGYGISSGKIEKETDIYEDAFSSWLYLTKELGIHENKIIIWGWSMGGAVAVNLAQHKKCHALVMESTFYSLFDMAKKVYWFLPYKLLIRFLFSSGDKLININMPVLFIHSKQDETVPYINGVRLFEKFSGKKKFIEISDDHNYGIFNSQQKFVQEAMPFLNY